MPKFVKTFDASGIARVLNIYPYEYLPAASMPSFKNVQEIRDYVTKFYGADPETVKGMKKEQLLKALLRIVLRRHIAAVDEEKARLAERNTNDNNIQSNNE